MAITIISGAVFTGVEAHNAPGTGNGYVIGTTPVCEFLRVDEGDHAAGLIGLKYSHHSVTDPACLDRKAYDHVKMTMVVSGGPWRQWLWIPGTQQSVEFTLSGPGDFIV